MVANGSPVDAIILEGLFKVFREQLTLLVKVVASALNCFVPHSVSILEPDEMKKKDITKVGHNVPRQSSKAATPYKS